MPGRCCIFQPFDNNGPHDKRYADIIEPAIKATDLEPYRVDRDGSVLVPIDSLHETIKSCTVCLADISTVNPNVMYEIGAAIGAGKDVLMISSSGAASFPFDIRHRTIVEYQKDSSSDFERLKGEITTRLRAIVRKQSEVQEIVGASPLKSTHGLRPQEVTALALIMATRDGPNDSVSAARIRNDMEKAGFTRFATNLALTSLVKQGFLEPSNEFDPQSESAYSVYILTGAGEDWLLENQEGFEFRLEPPKRRTTARPPQPLSEAGVGDDDVPF